MDSVKACWVAACAITGADAEHQVKGSQGGKNLSRTLNSAKDMEGNTFVLAPLGKLESRLLAPIRK